MNFSRSFTKIFQFGYIFLVILGVISECTFYKQIGIQILRFSSLMDILISPIATLIADPIRLFVLLIFIGLLMIGVSLLFKYRKNKFSQAFASIKNIESLSDEEIEIRYNNLFVRFLCLIMISFFLGMAIGFGNIVSNRIINNQTQYNTKIIFSNGESELIYLLHTNSSYNIYFSKGNKNAKIAPVGAIKNIEFTNNPKLK